MVRRRMDGLYSGSIPLVPLNPMVHIDGYNDLYHHLEQSEQVLRSQPVPPTNSIPQYLQTLCESSSILSSPEIRCFPTKHNVQYLL